MTEDLDIQLHIGVGPLILGDNIENISRILGPPNRVLEHRFSSGKSFYYQKSCIMVDVDSENNAEAFELSAPYNPKLENYPFISKPFSEARVWLESHDSDMEFDGASLISRKLGIGIFASSAEKAPEEPVESIIVFRKNYYD